MSPGEDLYGMTIPLGFKIVSATEAADLFQGLLEEVDPATDWSVGDIGLIFSEDQDTGEHSTAVSRDADYVQALFAAPGPITAGMTLPEHKFLPVFIPGWAGEDWDRLGEVRPTVDPEPRLRRRDSDET